MYLSEEGKRTFVSFHVQKFEKTEDTTTVYGTGEISYLTVTNETATYFSSSKCVTGCAVDTSAVDSREECSVPTADADFSGVGFQVFGRNQALSHTQVFEMPIWLDYNQQVTRLFVLQMPLSFLELRQQEVSSHHYMQKKVTRIKLFERLRRAKSTKNKIT